MAVGAPGVPQTGGDEQASSPRVCIPDQLPGAILRVRRIGPVRGLGQ